MRVQPFDYDVDVIRAELNRIRHPFRIAVTRAKNPFNIGAIIRTAHSFLAREIVLIGNERFYERGAMQMDRYENIRMVETEAEFVALAAREGWSLTVFEKDHADASLWTAPLERDAVLVFGNEDTGVPEVIREAAAQTVAIPMFGINHSFPVAISAGIAMAEWARRHASGPRIVIPSESGARFA